jgi:hypothetical protein
MHLPCPTVCLMLTPLLWLPPPPPHTHTHTHTAINKLKRSALFKKGSHVCSLLHIEKNCQLNSCFLYPGCFPFTCRWRQWRSQETGIPVFDPLEEHFLLKPHVVRAVPLVAYLAPVSRLDTRSAGMLCVTERRTQWPRASMFTNQCFSVCGS